MPFMPRSFRHPIALLTQAFGGRDAAAVDPRQRYLIDGAGLGCSPNFSQKRD